MALLSTSALAFVTSAVAYPDFYAQTPLSDVVGFKAGGDWGVMGIAKFEDVSEGACDVTSDVPIVGFEAGRNYTINVTSSVEDGVAHIVWPSAGAFPDAPAGAAAPVHTQRTDTFSAKGWSWTSPEDDEAAELHVICATGYLGKAYATSLKLVRAAPPSPPPAPTPSYACPEDAQASTTPARECLWQDGVAGFRMPPAAEPYCDYLGEGYFGYRFTGDFACAASARRSGQYCLWENGQRGLIIPSGASADCEDVRNGRIGFTLPSGGVSTLSV